MAQISVIRFPKYIGNLLTITGYHSNICRAPPTMKGFSSAIIWLQGWIFMVRNPLFAAWPSRPLVLLMPPWNPKFRFFCLKVKFLSAIVSQWFGVELCTCSNWFYSVTNLIHEPARGDSPRLVRKYGRLPLMTSKNLSGEFESWKMRVCYCP